MDRSDRQIKPRNQPFEAEKVPLFRNNLVRACCPLGHLSGGQSCSSLRAPVPPLAHLLLLSRTCCSPSRAPVTPITRTCCSLHARVPPHAHLLLPSRTCYSPRAPVTPLAHLLLPIIIFIIIILLLLPYFKVPSSHNVLKDTVQ
jgi:hypothetical protein